MGSCPLSVVVSSVGILLVVYISSVVAILELPIESMLRLKNFFPPSHPSCISVFLVLLKSANARFPSPILKREVRDHLGCVYNLGG